MIDRGKHNLLGVLVDAVDYAAAVERIIRAASEQRPYAVSALAVHGVMTGYQDGAHRARINALDLVTPDGQPVRWALNLLHGAGLPERVYGPTLTLKVCERAAAEGLPIFLYGSKPETLERLRAALHGQFPTLTIAGVEPSKFRQVSADEKAEVVARIRASGARITIVGLGCPRQEVWAYEYREALGMPILAVGAAFDFHAGMVSQAPGWMQGHGLEWFYRLTREPRRLWRRYLILNPWYVGLVAAQALRLRHFSAAPNAVPTELSFG
jgi:exopolysaccharide biosynthesis WecB/TagA/CpsF family protein